MNRVIDLSDVDPVNFAQGRARRNHPENQLKMPK